MQKQSVDNEEQEKPPKSRSRASAILQKRMEKRHRRASLGKLISYIIALIVVLALMFWLRRGM